MMVQARASHDQAPKVGSGACCVPRLNAGAVLYGLDGFACRGYVVAHAINVPTLAAEIDLYRQQGGPS